MIQSNALTQIDDANVHPKRLTREVSHVAHVVGHVPDGNQPMEDGSPDASPANKLGVDRRVVANDYVIYRVVEERYQSGYSHYRERLSAQDAKYHGSQGGREKSFIDTEEFPRTAMHVHGISQSGKETRTNVRL